MREDQDKVYRVIMWGSGGVGKRAIQGIARRPNLQLVGAKVHFEDKVGKDIGVLAGIAPLGVAATNDADALLKMDADCVCHVVAGADRGLIKECMDDYCKILESGKNVVSTSVHGLVFPKGFKASMVDRLEAACKAGGASLYVSGIEPGFAGDHLPLTLLTTSDRVRSVRTIEIADYADEPNEFFQRETWGFGKPPDHKPLVARPGIMMVSWGPSIQMIAHAMGVQLDGFRETFAAEVTDKKMEVACGTIEAGTIAAIRFETIGVVGGRDAIIIEHVNRLGGEVAPHWPMAPSVTYRIVIEGNPNISCDAQFGFKPNDDPYDGGMVATAMRIVNAIPAVCEAEAGLVSALDLPLTTPLHAFDLQ